MAAARSDIGEARKQFGIEHMVNLYARLKEKTAEQWQTEFAARSAPEARPRPVPATPAAGTAGVC